MSLLHTSGSVLSDPGWRRSPQRLFQICCSDQLMIHCYWSSLLQHPSVLHSTSHEEQESYLETWPVVQHPQVEVEEAVVEAEVAWDASEHQEEAEDDLEDPGDDEEDHLASAYLDYPGPSSS